MISEIQKTKTLTEKILKTLKSGTFPDLEQTIRELDIALGFRNYGQPLAILNPAIDGQTIESTAINETLFGIREDLYVLYEALIRITSKSLDIYEVFSTTRDRLSNKISKLKTEVETHISQQNSGSRSYVFDSFNDLTKIDHTRTTAEVNLFEGTCSLPVNKNLSIRYNGEKVKLLKLTLPPGAKESGPSFVSIFSPYRTDAWYTSVKEGESIQAVVNVTGVNYEAGANAEVTLNSIQLEPTGPCYCKIEWSPDSYNWHELTPEASLNIDDVTSFTFEPVIVGYLRFTFTKSNKAGIIGFKRIQLLSQGYSLLADLYSVEYKFLEPIHTVSSVIEKVEPFGTVVRSYISQDSNGPWVELNQGPVTFDNISWIETYIKDCEEETPGVPSTFWLKSLPGDSNILPETGELIAGDSQVLLSSFKFSWKSTAERDHLPTKEDWNSELGEVRSGVFSPLSGGRGSADIGNGSFVDNQNPLTVDERIVNDGYLVLAILQGSGANVLQAGYNYKLTTYIRCLTPISLENQSFGVVNEGGSANQVIAPFSVYLNNNKVFQKKECTDTVAGLDSSNFQTTLSFEAGWNVLEVLIQVPEDVVADGGGAAASNVYFYMQPNLYANEAVGTLGIEEFRAYRDPWTKKSEFNLRYNTPIKKKDVWALKQDLSTGKYTDVLFNWDITNSNLALSPHGSKYTIDGLLVPYVTTLILRYPSEKSNQSARSLFFRSEFSKSKESSSPARLLSYKLLIN